MDKLLRALPALFVVACGARSLPPNAEAPAPPGPVSARTSSLEIDALQVAADGVSAATVRATLRDVNGRPTPGAEVSFIAAAGVQFDPALGAADAAGVFVSRVKSVEVGRRDLVLQTRGDSLHAGIEFVPGPPDAAKSALAVPGVQIASDGVTPAAVALASVFGLLRKTNDGGGSWTTSDAGLPVTQALQIIPDPTSQGTWFVQMLNDGIYKSDDGGATWRQSTPAALHVNPTGFSVVATSPATLLAADRGRAFRSVDAGETWSELVSPPALDRLDACAARPDVIFGASAAGIFRSGDGGASWTQAHPAFGPENFASAVHVDPADPNVAVVAFSTFGMLRTVDGGQSWSDVTPPSGNPGILDVAVSVADPATFFVESGDSIWRTHDRGTTWLRAADGLVANPAIEHLAISGADPLLGYAGTIVHGLWRTSTGGN